LAEEYLTTRELADLLRIKERKVYELAADGTIPCTRATGKLLFPRLAVQRWLADNSSGHQARQPVPALFSGSHDPLLEWAIRQSGCGIASLFDGSGDGLDKLLQRQATVAAIHLYDRASGDWNVPQAQARFDAQPVVLCEWVYRQRGFIHAANQGVSVAGLADLKLVARQAQAGSQIMFLDWLEQHNIDVAALNFVDTVHSEADAALAVQQGVAECAFGLQAMAHQYGLGFTPLLEERLDLLVDRRFWFEPPMQEFLNFCRGPLFARRVAQLGGYRLDQPLAVRFNGAG